jgi:hypothetical protein
MERKSMRGDSGGFDPRQLPEFMPDATLWPRILAAQQRRAARRRWQAIAFGGAIAATICLAVLVGTRVAPEGPSVASGMAIQDESRSLEGEWLRLAGAQAAAIGTTRLRAIDAELQAAYDRGADVDELGPLWQQRNRALRGLIAGMQDGALKRSTSITQI